MPADALVYELLLRGIAIGALASTAAGIWRAGPGRPVSVAALGLCVSIAGYAIESSTIARHALGPVAEFANIVSFSGAGFVWLLIVTLFEDRRINAVTLAPATVLTAWGLVGLAVPQGGLAERIFASHHIMQAALALHALAIIARGWRGDLVEARRRARGPFLAMVAFYTLTLSSVQTAEIFGLVVAYADLTAALALALLCFTGAVLFLRARGELLGAATGASPSKDSAESVDQPTLDKLDACMAIAEAWRREGLTIGALAEEVGVPEHRLRRLINDHLGFRNFAAFVNARRIEAAKALLTDPVQSRTTISAIAFDLGFGSLGPFNRAFKDATGVTPTEFRRGVG